MATNLLYSYRNPDSTRRPTFCDIVVSLQRPDFQILKYSEEDQTKHSKEALTLGQDMQRASGLYLDLQRIYHQQQRQTKGHNSQNQDMHGMGKDKVEAAPIGKPEEQDQEQDQRGDGEGEVREQLGDGYDLLEASYVNKEQPLLGDGYDLLEASYMNGGCGGESKKADAKGEYF